MVALLSSARFNFVAFNLLWLGLVLGREDLLWLTAPLVFAYTGFLLYRKTIKPWQLIIPAALGLSIDLVVIATGLLRFNSPFLIPLWLPLLWLSFSTALALSIRFIADSRALSAIGGALGFPFAYWAGLQLNAVVFSQSLVFVLLFLAAIWAHALPLITGITRYYINTRYGTA